MLRASWTDRDGTLWIELEGEMDHDDCLRIRDEFHERIAKGEGDVVVVLAGVTFLSSMGIGMLTKAHTALAAQGRALTLSGIPDRIRPVFEAMNLLEVFTVV